MSANELGDYHYSSSVGAGVVTLPDQAALFSVSAFCSAPGATVQVGAGDVTPIPPGGSITQFVNAGMVSTTAVPIVVTFIGTDGYLVDWFGG